MQTDVLIIGAGPSGLFAAFQAGMLGMRSVIVDIMDAPGGQCSALYPEKPIYDIPGYPEIKAGILIDQLLAQLKPFNTHFFLSQQVNSLRILSRQRQKDCDVSVVVGGMLLGKSDVASKDLEDVTKQSQSVLDMPEDLSQQSTNQRDSGVGLSDAYSEIFQVCTSAGNEIEAKVVLIAAGSGAFGPNKPPLDGIEEYEGKSVFYFIPQRSFFAKKKILIAGGGDSALDWAISLSEIADVSIVHRRSKFRAAPATIEKLHDLSSKGVINIISSYQLKGLEGENGILKTVILSDLDGCQKRVEADILLPFFGLRQDLGPILDFGLSIKNHHIKVSAPYYQTNIEGIYAIGDVASYEGKLKLILTSFAEAASAMHHAYSRVFDGKALHFEYSTTRGNAPI